MYVLFEAEVKKYLNTTRYFIDAEPTLEETIKRLGRNYFGAINTFEKLYPEPNIDDIEARKEYFIKLSEHRKEYKKYVKKILSKYAVIHIPAGTFGTPKQDCEYRIKLRQAKKVELGQLRDRNTDGSYPYYEGVFTIIPPDPPTAEEITKREKKKTLKKEIKLLYGYIRDLDDLSDIQKGVMAFDIIRAQEKYKEL